MIALSLCAAAGLFVLIVQVSAVNMLRTQNAAAIARVAPRHPSVVMRQALLEFERTGGLSQASLDRVAQAAPRVPIAQEPLLFHGLRLLALGQRQSAARFLEEAQRREPRSRVIRFVLLDLYLRAGMTGPAAGEIRVLLRLVPGSDRVLMPELARLARDPGTRASLARALRGDPLMDSVLEQLIRGNADPALVVSLAERSGRLAHGGTAPQWQSLLLNGLIERGEYQRARAAWRRFNSVVGDRARSPVYDPGFEDLPGGPPFDWQLGTSANGYAGFAPGPSLQIEYYGRENTDLASQLLTLAPGTYRLTFQVRGGSEASGARLAWRIACLGGDTMLLDLPVPADAGARMVGGGFAVPPANCPAQWIRLVGLQSEGPGELAVSISRLSLQGGPRP